MWKFEKETFDNSGSVKFVFFDGARSLTFGRILTLLQTSPEFRQFFIGLLAQTPFPAYRWECPAVTSQTLDQPFEFVIIDDPSLQRRPEANVFRQHFSYVPNNSVISFHNLGRDAILVVPEPADSTIDYSHLGAFCCHAPQSQQHTLWQKVGEVMSERVNNKPVWLSTAGGGVAWLHVRLDDRPKYYRHRPYRPQSTY